MCLFLVLSLFYCFTESLVCFVASYNINNLTLLEETKTNQCGNNFVKNRLIYKFKFNYEYTNTTIQIRLYKYEYTNTRFLNSKSNSNSKYIHTDNKTLLIWAAYAWFCTIHSLYSARHHKTITKSWTLVRGRFHDIKQQ